MIFRRKVNDVFFSLGSSNIVILESITAMYYQLLISLLQSQRCFISSSKDNDR